MANAGRGMGHGMNAGGHVGKAEGLLDEHDLTLQGNQNLLGDSQGHLHNQRYTMPGETDRTEGVVESFERMDPRVRAGKD